VIILLRQGKEETLSYAYGLGVEEHQLRGPRQLRLDSALMERVGCEEAGILLHEPPRSRDQGILAALRKAPWLAVALRHSKEPFGLILAAERAGDGAYTENDLQILSYIGDSASVAIHKQMMTGHLRNSYLNVIQALAYAIEAKDPYTRGHSERVARYAVALARRMGLSDHEALVISHAAILHDIGKVEISGEILQKPGGLTEDEYTDMQDHPALGEIMLEGIPFLNEARALIRHHHERWDGRGYPDGLQGDAIPLGARVIAIADVYDALTLHRSYRQGTSKERAILHLRREKGSRLDPYLVEVFITVLQETA
jgi:putative nucleotidyltransferase with HDIG domain